MYNRRSFFLIEELHDEARRSNIWQIRVSERKHWENQENKIIKEIIPEIFPELKDMSLQIEQHTKYPNNKRTKAHLYDILEHQDKSFQREENQVIK